MQAQSLKGVTYEARKRTTPRNHQADLAAREHYQNRREDRPYQVWVTNDNGVTFTPTKI